MEHDPFPTDGRAEGFRNRKAKWMRIDMVDQTFHRMRASLSGRLASQVAHLLRELESLLKELPSILSGLTLQESRRRHYYRNEADDELRCGRLMCILVWSQHDVVDGISW
jgi:hypothetical protein